MWTLLRPDAATVIQDKNAAASLARYFAVMQNQKPAKFQIAKKLAAMFGENDPLEELWKRHNALTGEFFEFEKRIDSGHVKFDELKTPEKSYLDLKAKIAGLILQKCHFCTRECGVNRTKGEVGYCGCGREIVVSTMFEHMGEEPELVPSGTIFTMGCTMRCKHCQNWTISQWMEKGEIYKPEKLAVEIERLRANGCRNANLVGGEPTPWLFHWLETFRHVKVNVPIVWNSNSYYGVATSQLLAGFADVYLLDFKYGSGECAARLSDAPNYWMVCKENHLSAMKNGELIIRVLVLPNHIECCAQPIINWIAENLGAKTRVNIMFQYRPEWLAHEIPDLERKLTEDEKKQAILLAKKAKLENLIT